MKTSEVIHKTILGSWIIFLLFSLWWVYLTFFTAQTDVNHQLFGALYGIMALYGGVYGIQAAKQWGGLKSYTGRSILFFSFGLLLQEFGQLMYSYYTYFERIEVPYPSLGDIGYFGSIGCYIIAVYYLARISGVHITLRSFSSKIQTIIVPFILLLSGYFLFLVGYQFEGTPLLTIFLDFGYPLGQAVYISQGLLTYLLCRKVLGGMMRGKVLFILFALCIQFLADYTFLYGVRQGWVYAGGPNDYLYLLAYFLMTFGLLQLNTVFARLKET